MKKYFKKKIVIEAVKWTGKNLYDVTSFIDGKCPTLNSDIARDKWADYERLVKFGGLTVKTMEGVMKAVVGCYIIKGVKGEFYPHDGELFEEVYEEFVPLRTPDPNGVLLLTLEELEEYKEKFNPFMFQGKFTNIQLDDDGDCCEIFKHDFTRDKIGYKITSTKAILWLAERFNLNGDKG